MWAASSVKFDVEGLEAIEQRRLAIEMPFLKAAFSDVILSVLEKSEHHNGRRIVASIAWVAVSHGVSNTLSIGIVDRRVRRPRDSQSFAAIDKDQRTMPISRCGHP